MANVGSGSKISSKQLAKSTNIVFDSYGKYYDILYSDKNYEVECDFLEEIFETYSKFKPRNLLDVGCGTGGHAVPMAKRGYKVTGIDQSEEMINIAKRKAVKNEVDISYYVMDLRELRLHEKYDACICMFAVINYIDNNEDLLKGLTNIRNHVVENAIIVCDFWYGPAVLSIRPTSRMKTIEKDGIKVTRYAQPHLKSTQNMCEVTYRFKATKGNSVIYEGEEKHNIRFYFPEDIKTYLEKSGLQLLKLCPFLDLSAQPSVDTWNVMAISQAM